MLFVGQSAEDKDYTAVEHNLGGVWIN